MNSHTMNHYLLFYDFVENYVAKRAPLRDEHLHHAMQAQDRGELLLAGAMAEPTDGAVLLFRGSTPEVASAFARADPYVIHKAHGYREHLSRKVVPALNGVPGYIGCQLLRRRVEEGIEFMVMTDWESMDWVRTFAGADPSRAVVEPDAREVLTRFDSVVRHYEREHVGIPTAE